MKAKDTVTKTNEENCYNTLEERLAEQAEISFNAGQQKVVEWINQEGSLWDKHFPFTEVVRVMNEERWQAFCYIIKGETDYREGEMK